MRLSGYTQAPPTLAFLVTPLAFLVTHKHHQHWLFLLHHWPFWLHTSITNIGLSGYTQASPTLALWLHTSTTNIGLSGYTQVPPKQWPFWLHTSTTNIGLSGYTQVPPTLAFLVTHKHHQHWPFCLRVGRGRGAWGTTPTFRGHSRVLI